VLLGVSITVSDLPAAMRFMRPVLEFLEYVPEGPGTGEGVPVVVSISPRTGSAVDLWAARPELADRPFEVYAPGLHHVAFDAERRDPVDRLAELVRALGGEILDGPDEFPCAEGGYHEVYFRGPDGIQLEVAHMPELEHRYRELGALDAPWMPPEDGRD